MATRMCTSHWMSQLLGAGEVCAKFKQEAEWRRAPEVDASPCHALCCEIQKGPPRQRTLRRRLPALPGGASCPAPKRRCVSEEALSPTLLAVCNSRKLTKDTVSKTDCVFGGYGKRKKFLMYTSICFSPL